MFALASTLLLACQPATASTTETSSASGSAVTRHQSVSASAERVATTAQGGTALQVPHVSPSPWVQSCMNPKEKRPRILRRHQRETKRLLRHVVDELDGSADFYKLLRLAAMRETSLQGSQKPFDGYGVVHRLNPDIESGFQAWRRLRPRLKDNPYYDERELWYGGAGLFGFNKALWISAWDRKAHPWALCDSVVGTLAIARSARRKLRKFGAPVRCWKRAANSRDYVLRPDGKRETEMVRRRPTWRNLHRALFAGRLCAGPDTATARYYRRVLNRRAARVGLDLEAIVTKRDLGHEPKGDQVELVAQLWDGFLKEAS